ncbi:Endophilin-A3 [Clonorchis sinensis]|uniref:Endophilin-A3 n=1 Tax=Clonorchis sinensis TaxID=79923 RepID=A0A8T1MZC9_CLOSI|nr:Endophilin-A3 [Clonorchis sinensis]
MPLNSLFKKIERSNQYLTQKLTKAKGTDVGEEYKQLSALIDVYKSYFEEVKKRSMECLEPGANIRIRPTPTAEGSHNNPATNSYPHAEFLLGQCFEKYAKALDVDSPLGSALLSAGESYWQLTEAKKRAVEEARLRFVSLISETLKQDIKEIIALRKKAENRRLTYDAERSKVEKSKLAPNHPDYVEAQRQFQEAFESSHDAMANFLESDAEHIEMLSNFVSAQMSYFQDGQRVLSDLQTRLQSKLEEARNNPGARVAKAATAKSAVCADSNMPASPRVELKPKHSEESPRVPRCQALYDFEAENPFELSFHQGDIITLLEQVDENWFLGEFQGQHGHFPTNYVQVLVPLV